METAALAVAAMTYAGSMVLHKVADKAIEDAYERLIVFIKSKFAGTPPSPADTVARVQELAAEPAVLQEAEQVYGLSPVLRRAHLVAPVLRGAHLLWVDDNPDYTAYERATLASLGVEVDVCCSTLDALWRLANRPYDLVLSDMLREGVADAGLQLLNEMRRRGHTTALVFYIGHFAPERGTPPGAFGITNRPDELLHYICDVLERVRFSAPGEAGTPTARAFA